MREVEKKYQNHLFLFLMFVCFVSLVGLYPVLPSSLVDDVYLPIYLN